jgi:hypothetical protein
MNYQDMRRLFAGLQRVPMERRAAIDATLATLGAEVAKAQLAPQVGGPDALGSGAPIEIGFQLDLALEPLTEETVQAVLSGKQGGLLAMAPEVVTPALVTALQKAEPEALAWLRSSPANAARFAVDPLGALGELGKDIDPALLAPLRAAQAAQKGRAAPTPGVRLDSVRVTVANAAGGKAGA